MPDPAEVRRLLAEQGIDPSYQAFVENHLDTPDDQWRWCCGSQCDPCVRALGRAVDAARALVGRAPPPPLGGLPAPSAPA